MNGIFKCCYALLLEWSGHGERDESLGKELPTGDLTKKNAGPMRRLPDETPTRGAPLKIARCPPAMKKPVTGGRVGIR